jgi:allantoicase
MDTGGAAATFTGLIDLAAASLGGRAVGASDDFFASVDNLLLPGRGVFVEGKFTDRGKWMDGWESRRKRGPRGAPRAGSAAGSALGHDWCVLELGATGTVLGFDIDTNHFLGNHPPFASVEGVYAPKGTPLGELSRADWLPLLPQAPLRPGSQNLFTALPRAPMSHVRLNIFPDGGVARFRAFGRVHAEWTAGDLDDATRAWVAAGSVDLAALKNGGLTLACSDAFFGPMNNLLLPGRAENMGGGWETRRKRGDGHDWIVIQLGARGRPRVIEVDTRHFKGNFPDQCAIEAIDAGDLCITELIASAEWTNLLAATELGPDRRHFFDELTVLGSATHLRLHIYPDGGISRLRVWGDRDA